MKISVFDLTGTKKKELNLDDSVFGQPVNAKLLAQAVRVYRSNQRQSAAQVQTRSEIDYTKKKMFKQKGTGNARHGSRKAAIMVGGFKAHGPRADHNFKLELPKKMRMAALRSALAAKVADGRLVAVEGFTTLKAPKTKTMAACLAALKGEAKSQAVVFTKEMELAQKSARNLVKVECYPVDTLTTFEVVSKQQLVLPIEAIEALTKRLKKNNEL